MTNTDNQLIIYGAERCHKCVFYKQYLTDKGLKPQFLDVEENEGHAEALRALYTTGKLNFPTLLVGGKKLRNPATSLLDKWLVKKGFVEAIT